MAPLAHGQPMFHCHAEQSHSRPGNSSRSQADQPRTMAADVASERNASTQRSADSVARHPSNRSRRNDVTRGR